MSHIHKQWMRPPACAIQSRDWPDLISRNQNEGVVRRSISEQLPDVPQDWQARPRRLNRIPSARPASRLSQCSVNHESGLDHGPGLSGNSPAVRRDRAERFRKRGCYTVLVDFVAYLIDCLWRKAVWLIVVTDLLYDLNCCSLYLFLRNRAWAGRFFCICLGFRS